MTVRSHRATANAAKPAARTGLTILARFGYLALGIVYIVIGILAFWAAMGRGGATTDQRGALETIYNQPFGAVLLFLVALGLAGHGLWRFVQAGWDTENKGTDAKGIATRIGYAVIGVSYLVLSFAAFRLALGSGGLGGSSEQSTQDWTARLMEQPFGQVLVVIAGLIVLGVAIAQFFRTAKASFLEKLDLSELDQRGTQLVKTLGRVGHAARGAVFGIIGIFLMIAAWQHSPQQAKGLGGALQELAQQPFGPFLLAAVALGMFAFGLFCVAEARYRIIRAPAA